MENDARLEKSFGLFYFKTGLLLFWFAWFGLAFLSNLFDLLSANEILTKIPFHSGNYQALKTVISIYHTPNFILNILFYFDILAELLVCGLFLLAAYFFFTLKPNYWKFINLAFMLSMALWGVFSLMEEIFLAYSFEPTHIRLCMFEMLSLLIFHLLPTQYDEKIR